MRIFIIVILLVVAFALGVLVGSYSQPAPASPKPKAKEASNKKAAANTSGISLSPLRHNFGKTYEGKYIEQKFGINRPEGSSLRIARLYSPCPCVTVKADKRIFTADESGNITVGIHTLTLNGKKSFPVYVEVVEPAKTTIRADIEVEVERIPAMMRVQPFTFRLGSINGKKRAEVKIQNLTKRPIRLKKVSCQNESVKLKLAEGNVVAAGKEVTLRLEVAPENLSKGAFRNAVSVETDCPEHARIDIPVEGTVIGK